MSNLSLETSMTLGKVMKYLDEKLDLKDKDNLQEAITRADEAYDSGIISERVYILLLEGFYRLECGKGVKGYGENH